MKEKVSISALKQVKKVFDNHNIEFWLDYGTLLGAVRDGKFIPWDNDIDLRTWYGNLPKIISVCEELRDKGFKVYCTGAGVRITCKGGYPIGVIGATLRPVTLVGKFFEYLYGVLSAPRCFELEHYREVNRRATYATKSLIRKSLIGVCLSLPSLLRRSLAKIAWAIHKKFSRWSARTLMPIDYFTNLSTIRFYGMEFKVPAKTEEYLAYMYGGDWKVPKRNWGHGSFVFGKSR